MTPLRWFAMDSECRGFSIRAETVCNDGASANWIVVRCIVSATRNPKMKVLSTASGFFASSETWAHVAWRRDNWVARLRRELFPNFEEGL